MINCSEILYNFAEEQHCGNSGLVVEWLWPGRWRCSRCCTASEQISQSTRPQVCNYSFVTVVVLESTLDLFISYYLYETSGCQCGTCLTLIMLGRSYQSWECDEIDVEYAMQMCWGRRVCRILCFCLHSSNNGIGPVAGKKLGLAIGRNKGLETLMVSTCPVH